MLEGEVVLREDAGETVLKPGDAAAGRPALQRPLPDQPIRAATRSSSKSARARPQSVHYPDIDMMVTRDDKGARYTHKNGEPY